MAEALREVHKLTIIVHPIVTSRESMNKMLPSYPPGAVKSWLDTIIEHARNSPDDAILIVERRKADPEIRAKEKELADMFLQNSSAGRVAIIEDISTRSPGWKNIIPETLGDSGLRLMPGVGVTIAGGYLELSVLNVASVVLDALGVQKVTIDKALTFDNGGGDLLERSRRQYERMGYFVGIRNDRYWVMTKAGKTT